MQTTKKKPSLIFILVGAVLAGYLGYLINGAWTEGIAFNEFMDRFNEVCAVPFANYYNSNTVKAVAIALGIYAMAIVMYYTSQRNYMPGKEFGTARFENPKQVNKILADKDENFNRILSQNVKMSLDFRRLKLNGNILICGGSGAGKTFYEVKPNLMQMPHNCSFICTDPKGEILRSCGQMLKNNGYNVKVINLLEMDKSDCYNPFSYIREETDVVKLITNLISNTTPKGATPSDPFWEKAEGLFLQAIFYYVWLEVQPAKRNFETDGKGKPYVHQIRGTDNLIGPPFEILSDKAVKYYEKLKDKGENVYIDSLTYEQFMMLGDAELSRRFSMQDEAKQKAKIDREQANELEYVDESQKSDAAESANTSNGSAGAKPVRNPEREKPKWEDTITNRMLHWSYTPEQKEEVKKALAAGVPKATILTYFYPEVTVEKMSSYRKKQ